jgi:zinc protease
MPFAVEKHRLDNGLTLLLAPDPSAPVIAYQTWYRVGSRHEKPGRTGLAHLFEHLMFNQTETLQAGEFDRLMESAGGETNAATWVDWTYYRDSLPADQLELAVRLEADRMHHLTLTDAQVESEREVVANERRFRVDDDVEGFLAEELFRLAFTRHPYRHPTIGWMADIMAITPSDAREFYRQHYAPNNAVVVLVGDFEPAAARRLVEARYAKIPAAAIPDEALPVEPPQGEERRARFPKPVAAERAIFAYKTPSQAHPDWLALQAVNELLCGSPSARLYRDLVIVREAASTVQAAVMPFSHPGLFEIVVMMKRGHGAAVAEEALDAAVIRLQDELIPAAELEKVKNRLATEFWSELDTVDGKAEQLGHHEVVLGDHRGLFAVAEQIEALTPSDLRRVAARYLLRTARTLVVAEPSGEAESADDEEDDGDGDDGEEDDDADGVGDAESGS